MFIELPPLPLPAQKMRTPPTRLRFEEGEFKSKCTEFDAAKKEWVQGVVAKGFDSAPAGDGCCWWWRDAEAEC